ncbi:MAG: DMT family transporter [Desulfobacteraceae bacterium]|jgi:drug/metabolite transporter (DMT)-like permease
MKRGSLKSDAILLLTALIWGFAFVAQRAGMAHVGPFTFNGVRFALGSFSLLPLLFAQRKQISRKGSILPQPSTNTVIIGGSLAGSVLFVAASLQQVGLVYTTAGKAGFITGLYVVIVPILGLLLRQRPGVGTWIGAVLAAVGLYLLSITEAFTIDPGDFLEIIGAFFWAAHVLIIGWFSPRIASVQLAFFQFAACSVLSLLSALLTEAINLSGLIAAAIPILYGGLVSVGMAYTLQVVGQKGAQPAHAAIILSLEAVFAVLGGWLILSETLSTRGLIGCALMFSAMLISQIPFKSVDFMAGAKWVVSRRNFVS